MHRSTRLAITLACAAPLSVRAQAPVSSPRPTLVVFFTIDQMRADYLERFGAQFTGGLGRLVKGGAVFVNAFQDHANTETAPGHASVLSGRFPRSTGIVSNTLGVFDPESPLIDAPGLPASPFRFRGSTLIDWLRAQDSGSRALSVSRKDRGAILPLGRAHQAVYWYAANGHFTTSRYYADTLPTWVKQFNAGGAVLSYVGKTWDLLLPDSAYPEPDSVWYENGGRNYMFPHVMPEDPTTAALALAVFPFMDELTLEFALRGLEEMGLGKGPSVDVLAISLSTTDAIGHAFGPDSREIHDQILRLDRMMGTFLDSLYQLRDQRRVIVALTSDHGVQSIPDVYMDETGQPAFHVDLGPLVSRFQQRLAARGVADTAAFHFDDAMLWMDRKALQRARVDADSVIEMFVDSVRKVPGVLRVHTPAMLAQRDTIKDDVVRRWVHMLPPDLPIEVVVTLYPHSIWGTFVGATHGSPLNDDAHVPIILYGPPFRPGTYSQLARVVDMAPTIAAVLRVRPTQKLDGIVLTRALKSPGSK